MVRRYAKKLMWGILFLLIGCLLNYFIYPVIIALFSAVFGIETIWINLVHAWPAVVFWIVAYSLRVNQSSVRRAYLSALGEKRPTLKETFIYVIRRDELMLDFLAFLTILFIYLMWIVVQTQSFWLFMFYFWIYTPLYLLSDVISWFLVYRGWQKDKY